MNDFGTSENIEIMNSASLLRLRKTIEAISGTIFFGAGAFKLLVPFGDFLAKMGVPFPQFLGTSVALLEVSGGAMLLLHRRFRFLPAKWRIIVLRLFCLGLALDMVFAILLVGAPGKRGRTFNFGGHQIGGESWRLPLELFLLTAMICLVARPPAAQE